MVFKPINLARSVISKTFPNGSAQSLVAASQSSSATHNTHFHTLSSNFVGYFGKAGPPGPAQQGQYGSHNAVGGANNTKADTYGSASDKGLDAYYAAWYKHHRTEDKEKHHLPFAKRLGWKAPTTIPEGQTQAKPSTPVRPSHRNRPSAVSVPRARSASAIDDIKPLAQEDVAYASAVAPLAEDEALDTAQVAGAKEALSTSPAAQEIQNSSAAPFSSDVSASTQSIEVSSPAQSTEATSVSETDAYTNQLASLAEQGRHAETLVVFQALLRENLKPTSTAYNALLLAAINLPRGKHQVIPKVLDVYSDMLSRQVAPDTSTYAILIEVLSARAMDVSSMKGDLVQKQARHGAQGFLFASDEAEHRILAEDDSLGLAIKLFDTSAAITTNHAFSAETYSALISACAEQSRISDMVRIYAEMESQVVQPPTAIFAPMIQAFASAGDLRSSVECYEEYKNMAVAHDLGQASVDRRDEEIYAALVKAYAVCDQASGGLKFLSKIEDTVQNSPQMLAIRDAVALRALVPNWIGQQAYGQAIEYASTTLSSNARAQALSAIGIDAADKNDVVSAAEALKLLQLQVNWSPLVSAAAASLLAAHVRSNNLESANRVWQTVTQSTPDVALVEPLTMFVESHFQASNLTAILSETRQLFAKIRGSVANTQAKTDALERVNEAISIIGRRFLQTTAVPSASVSLELLQAMAENDTVSAAIAEHLMASLGPNEISSLQSAAIVNLLQVQAKLLLDRPQLDAGHVARLDHLTGLVTIRSMQLDSHTTNIVRKAATSVSRADLAARLHNVQPKSGPAMVSPTPYSSIYSPPAAVVSPAFDESYDPYASSTDFKGSNVIAEELEKTYGRHAAHLNEALSKFRNIRRAGRHPRYVTYGKLITAAAKENRMNMAQDILAMAKQDIPILPQSGIAMQGWVNIFDCMVSACLTMGRREAASQYHNELLSMGFAPSANTFGLYITTLKEGTKTFDEATEAVKIFHQAKRESVEPTSFLYNALIGKLGKARRIDDCLFYFAEMRQLGIRPTSVTYGTIVNALCRVSDDKFAEELFEEMESMPNYKPRPAPYNSLMQYFLTTKRDRSKVLTYYERMCNSHIEPTMHTYKLLIDTHATLEPVDMRAAEFVLAEIKLRGMQPEAVHYSALIHAKGCVLHDLPAARSTFDQVIAEGYVQPCASLYQAIFESMVANHDIASTESLLKQMSEQHVRLTPYIANTLIHGWALVKEINKARSVYDALGMEKREPSTYEAMTRAYLAVEDRGNAKAVVGEALRRGYPSAVAGKICDLIGGA